MEKTFKLMCIVLCLGCLAVGPIMLTGCGGGESHTPQPPIYDATGRWSFITTITSTTCLNNNYDGIFCDLCNQMSDTIVEYYSTHTSVILDQMDNEFSITADRLTQYGDINGDEYSYDGTDIYNVYYDGDAHEVSEEWNVFIKLSDNNHCYGTFVYYYSVKGYGDVCRIEFSVDGTRKFQTE